MASDLRESRDEMKRHIFNKYVNVLTINRLIEFVPTFLAFKRGIFLDEKYSFEKGKLKAWVEFTDPTNTTGLLVYTFGNDPFSNMEWDNPIPNRRLRANNSNIDQYGIDKHGIHVLNGHL